MTVQQISVVAVLTGLLECSPYRGTVVVMIDAAGIGVRVLRDAPGVLPRHCDTLS